MVYIWIVLLFTRLDDRCRICALRGRVEACGTDKTLIRLQYPAICRGHTLRPLQHLSSANNYNNAHCSVSTMSSRGQCQTDLLSTRSYLTGCGSPPRQTETRNHLPILDLPSDLAMPAAQANHGDQSDRVTMNARSMRSARSAGRPRIVGHGRAALSEVMGDRTE